MKPKLISIVLCVCFVLSLFSACGNGEEVQTDLSWVELELGGNTQTVAVSEAQAEEVLFGKYYVFSKENEEQELLWDFEYRLMQVEVTYHPDHESIDVGSVSDFIRESIEEECAVKSLEEGISFEDYVRKNYTKDSSYFPESPWSNFSSETYFVSIAEEYGSRWTRVNCVARLWGVEADQNDIEKFLSEGMTEQRAEYEALKLQIFRRSVENAKIVYRHKSPWLFLLQHKAWDSISTNTGPDGAYYVEGEGGYAALYKPWFMTTGYALEPYVGEHIYGTSSNYGTYRLADREDWDYIVVRRGRGVYMLATFDHWIEEGGEEYDNFVTLYGVEPKIHP